MRDDGSPPQHGGEDTLLRTHALQGLNGLSCWVLAGSTGQGCESEEPDVGFHLRAFTGELDNHK